MELIRVTMQNASIAMTTYALFYNGSDITNEILSVAKFEKLVKKLSKV